MARIEKKEICPVCGGTGQVSFFKGASRFLLSVEECEACAGTGYVLDAAAEIRKKDTGIKPGKKK